MKRIVIDQFADGHIYVDQQVLLSNRKITGDKRKRDLQPDTWQRIDRSIFRDGALTAMPEQFALANTEVLPLGSEEIALQATANDALAADGVDFAKQIVWAINKQIDAPPAPPAKKRRLVWVEEE